MLYGGGSAVDAYSAKQTNTATSTLLRVRPRFDHAVYKFCTDYTKYFRVNAFLTLGQVELYK